MKTREVLRWIPTYLVRSDAGDWGGGGGGRTPKPILNVTGVENLTKVIMS